MIDPESIQNHSRMVQGPPVPSRPVRLVVRLAYKKEKKNGERIETEIYDDNPSGPHARLPVSASLAGGTTDPIYDPFVPPQPALP